MKKDKQKRIINPVKTKLYAFFILSVATILIISIGIFIILAYVLKEVGYFETENIEESGWFLILVFTLSSLTLGISLSVLFSRIILRPVNKLLDGLLKLSQGHYDTRLENNKINVTNQLNERFNYLAHELEDKEILASDFINNFSHELKTPVVSIKGLVKLLKENDLPVEKQREYLQIIEEETNRLSIMTTNILNLSKYENQEFIKDVSKFNLSEQIRACILLFEKKWTDKNLNLSIDFDEHYIHANEDMMKQVWINLIDNAIKFADENSDLTIDIKSLKKQVKVAITNKGPIISEEDIKKIYDKFYQVDKSRSKEGNGVGLSIVKRIIDLHKGNIEVASKDNLTTFIVTLNK